MTTEFIQYHLNPFLAATEGKVHFSSNGFKRVEQYYDGLGPHLVDIHSKYGVMIHYIRVALCGVSKKISISIAGTISDILESNDFGILLRVHQEERQYTVWLPSAPNIFQFDKYQRIETSCESNFSYKWQFYPHIQLHLSQHGQIGEVYTIPYIVLEDTDGQFYEELNSLTDAEGRLYRKSDWFFAGKPSDIWNYLINGSIYDPRSWKGVNKRFKCQQCAYAWWSYFGFLHKETGKKIYTVLQDEVAYSVLLDLSTKGEWGHGFWSDDDDIETHARFHLDGVHLLISQYKKIGEAMWLEAAERAMGFISKHLMEKLDDGSLWFLHDTIEHKQKHHFKSTLFGKSLGNTLCINTHVQALTVLYRLRSLIPDKNNYAEMFEKGTKALRRVLDHQPANSMYVFLMFLLMKNRTKAVPVSKLSMIKKGLESFIIQKIYWLVRRQFPRIVLPGGFVERDLTLAFFPDWYHITNVKDFLTLYQQESFSWLRSYIVDGIGFSHKFLSKLDLTNAIVRSPHYVEFIDILYLYDKLIERVPPSEIDSVREKIYQQTRGYSLDYYASELVRDS